MIFQIVTSVIAVSLMLGYYFLLKKIEKLTKRAQRVDDNINSLHQNQNVIVSTISQLHQEVQKNEREYQKGQKEIRRKVRVLPGPGVDGKGPNVVRPHQTRLEGPRP